MKRSPDQSENYAASRSPIYRALWEPGAADLPELFASASNEATAAVKEVMTQSLQVLLSHRAAGTLRGPDNKHSEQVLKALGEAGYWGLLVDREYGGSGCGLRHFLPFLTQAAVIDAPLAGLAAVHGCIGAVDPLQTFGTEEQKKKYLPALARGERLSAFASTEPGAGSDLKAVRTTAIRTNEGLRISGQKAFITNLAPGRTIGLLCKLDEQLAVVVTKLPDAENEHFQLVPNALHPLQHTFNQGLLLRDLPVTEDSLLQPPPGKDGRAIVFHGLNRGRAAICASAAGHLRVLLAGMIAWAKQRRVQGKPLAELELIQARCARVAALMAGCEALAKWCGTLLDAGYRGEIECSIAKIFASEAVKHAAFDLALPTHGGRFFLQGHAAGDMAYDYLAPCIYEGENDLLRLAVIQALLKSAVEPPASNHRDEWQTVREKLGQSGLLTGEKLLLSRRVELLTVDAVMENDGCIAHSSAPHPSPLPGVPGRGSNVCDQAPDGTSSERKLAGDLLRLRLRNQLRGEAASREELLAEIQLGRRLLDEELLWLGEVQGFEDPLSLNASARDFSQFSPSPRPARRSTGQRE